MKRTLKALNSIKGLKPSGEYTVSGETFTTDPETALELIAANAAVEVEEEADAEEETDNGEEALAKQLQEIAAARSMAELNALVADDEDRQEVIVAYNARADFLEPKA